jgi:bleomycin hydrolase
MRTYFFIACFFLGTLPFFAQQPYTFKTLIDIDATPVISQGRTGTCWSFSTSSFLESEIIRLTGNPMDLSEMYTVRNTYPKKAENYIFRQGKAQFSEGGLAHDVINAVKENGLVPAEVFSGLFNQEKTYNHAELEPVLKAMLDTYISNPAGKLSSKWRDAVEAILDIYIGKNISSFSYSGKNYTPKSFLKETKINPDDYISITSYTHQPFYSKFILNIPDNWSNGSFYNLPLDEFINTIDNALKNGYTVALDCDVSERTFSSKDGVAIIPEDSSNNIKALQGVYPEKQITQAYRQEEFENYDTTDDHLMHITGMLTDQNGTKYYKVKNSWGTDPRRNANGGYIYMSESYVRLKSISILLNRQALPKNISKKLKL